MIKYEDVKTSSLYIGLSKLSELQIKEVHGYLAHEFGGIVFKLSQIEFENGLRLGIEGEHDFPYLSYNDIIIADIPNLSDETLERLWQEDNNPNVS